MTQTLTIHEPKDLAQAEPKKLAGSHVEWLLQWVSPEARMLQIDSQEELEMAAQVIKEIKARAAEVDAGEKSFTKDLLGVVERLRDVFRPAKLLAKDGIELWSGKVLDSNRRRNALAAAKAREVEAALAAGNTEAAIVAHAQIKPVERVAGLQTRKTWKAAVINQGLLDDAYKVPDMAKITAEMRAQLKANPNETPVLPGVKFEQVEGLASV